MNIIIYHGYGHQHDLTVFGHVFANSPGKMQTYTKSMLKNSINLLRLFFVNPLSGIKVQLEWENQVFESVTEHDGFFKLEWKSKESTPAGWHNVHIKALDPVKKITASAEGKLFIPHLAQYVFISDIDDTILISHSATIFKRIKVLLGNNPHTRKTFNNVVEHYNALARSNTKKDVPNPFFYVSSSEWNLYNYLLEFFAHNKLPKGVFMLNQVKRWYQLLSTGKTKHEGKLVRVARILNTFPNQQFVLLGDNSQKDPTIYAAIAKKNPGKVYAVYIRNVNAKKANETIAMLNELERAGIQTCFYTHSEEAIWHSTKIGLIRE